MRRAFVLVCVLFGALASVRAARAAEFGWQGDVFSMFTPPPGWYHGYYIPPAAPYYTPADEEYYCPPERPFYMRIQDGYLTPQQHYLYYPPAQGYYFAPSGAPQAR